MQFWKERNVVTLDGLKETGHSVCMRSVILPWQNNKNRSPVRFSTQHVVPGVSAVSIKFSYALLPARVCSHASIIFTVTSF